VDDVSYGVLALALTLVGGTYTWWAFQHRGLGAALRGAGFTLLPAAAYLTDTLRMVTRIGDAIGDWATGLVFSPSVWLGIVVAGMAVLLVGAGRVAERRVGPARPAKQLGSPKSGGKGAPAIDDDLAEIEALLRKRGIT